MLRCDDPNPLCYRPGCTSPIGFEAPTASHLGRLQQQNQGVRTKAAHSEHASLVRTLAGRDAAQQSRLAEGDLQARRSRAPALTARTVAYPGKTRQARPGTAVAGDS
jgi:hypothetical protein